jgi:iron complex outermembrane receptor protein
VPHKSLSRLSLLSTTALIVTCIVPLGYSIRAHAADPTAPAATQPAAQTPTAAAKPDAKQAQAKPAVTNDKDEKPEEVVVTGQKYGSTGAGLLANSSDVKSSVASTAEYIATQSPTENPERLIALQPGIVVAAQDPYGVQPGNITVRGLNLNEVQFLFDGSPITNDGTFNSVEAVDAPNLVEVRLNPGSTNFDKPGSSGAAGTIDMLLRNPPHQAGGYVSGSYGSYNSSQEFVRLDTGDIGSTGIRGFISYSNFFGDDWRGPGTTTRQHVDAKFVKDWDNGSQTALSFEWTGANYQLERPPTLAQWNQYGKNYNYDSTFTNGDTNYYKLHQNVYDGGLATLSNKIVVTDNVTLNVTPYYYHAETVTPGAIVLSETSAYQGTQKISGLQLVTGNGTSPTSATLYTGTPSYYDRSGINANVAVDVDAHNKITAGNWFAFTELSQTGQFNYLSSTGDTDSLWGTPSTAVYLPNGQLYKFINNLQRIQTNVTYVGDRAQYLDNRLVIEAGFKFMIYRAQDFNRIPGVQYDTNNNQTEPMPSVAVRYSFNDEHQIFADTGVNARTPDPSQLTESVSANTGKISALPSIAQKIETSIIEEVGYRYNGALFGAQATLFNYNFTNRQVQTSVIQNGATILQYINAGGQTSRGLDVSIGSKPYHDFSLFVSGEYLHATIDNNIADQGDYLKTAGKTATGSPALTGNVSLNYDNGSLFGNIQAHYVSSQYSTFTNDEKLPGYATLDMAVGYRLPQIGAVKQPILKLNVMNITDNKYLTSIYATQFTSNNAKGQFGKTITGTAPTYIVGAPFSAIVTLSAAF